MSQHGHDEEDGKLDAAQHSPDGEPLRNRPIDPATARAFEFLPLHDVAPPMNHRSAFAPEDHAPAGYRPFEGETYGETSTYAPPSAQTQWYPQYGDHADAPQAEFGTCAPPPHADVAGVEIPHYESAARSGAGFDSWTTNTWTENTWAQQDWGQQNSWSDGGAWQSGDAWAEQGSWPAEQDSWPSEDASWTPADNGWAAEEAWPSEASDEEPGAPAAPVQIPARRSGAKRGGAHRLPAPPAALKGRAAVAAVAAGAVVAAGQAALAAPDQPSQAVDYEAAGQIHEIAAQSMNIADPNASPDSPQVLNVSAPAKLDQFNDILQKGQKYAEDLAAQEAAKLRPLFVKFTSGTFTSGFGARWGVQHLGIDVAGPIGTPIVAVADGTVLEAGPAAGFGMWVRLLHDDGTVTVYGHVDTATVSQGQRVTAGDQIATIGNRGFSTGPHCHFEVWLNGSDKIDPLPWLASRGISLGPQRD